MNYIPTSTPRPHIIRVAVAALRHVRSREGVGERHVDGGGVERTEKQTARMIPWGLRFWFSALGVYCVCGMV